MARIREYGWQDWISVPKNRELYNESMTEGLRQFKLEKHRRDKIIQAAVFNTKGFNGK
tara:strand:- start:315 stop:488 length:174 start_codon:yes stop_codon:yes gene_type:complete